MLRLALILLIAIGLSPGTWLRSPAPPDRPTWFSIRQLDVQLAKNGQLQLAGAWQLDSSASSFHGLSALYMQPDGSFIALSDRGSAVMIPQPGTSAPAPRIVEMEALKVIGESFSDMESLTVDPASGTIWIGMEAANVITRHQPDLMRNGLAVPRAMNDWGTNSGPEAMVRLADGRFIVLAEGGVWQKKPSAALLFPDDPVLKVTPVEFTFASPAGFRPVDMAQVPDGRVVILLRRVHLAIPLRFSGAIMVADPADIRAGEPWTGKIIGWLNQSMPSDNFEGLAVGQAAGGDVDLWVVSDANNSAFQRTLLLKLRWRPESR